MTTDVGICNMALSGAGTRSTISSLSEASEEAAQCAIHYEPVRKILLRAAPWNFARRQIALAVLGSASGTTENPDGTGILSQDPWAYEYAYPSDCIKIRYLMPNYAGAFFTASRISFLLSGGLDPAGNARRVILTNQEQAVLVYTASITNPNIFDDDFVTAFSDALTAKIAIPLTGDKSLAQQAAQRALMTVENSKAVNANESPAPAEYIPEWLATRGVSNYTVSDQYGGYIDLSTYLQIT